MDIERLLKRVKTGDTGALRTLYDTYTPLMREICASITKADAATIDDLVQESFILAYYSLDQLREASKFKSWITAITRNVALKHVERDSKIKFVSFPAVDANITATDVPTADSALNEKEIQELINKLPAGYGKVLRMSLEGFSHKEIADKLGIEPHSSSSQLARAKAMLRHAINKRTITIIALAIMSLPLIKHFFLHEEQKPLEFANGSESRRKNASGNMRQSSSTDVSTPVPPCYVKAASTHAGQASAIKPDTTATSSFGDSTALREPSSSTLENALAATEKHDSTTNSSTGTTPPPQDIGSTANSNANVAEENTGKRHKPKWQFLAAGSLGPALAQNVYALIANSITSGTTEPDGPIIGPTNFETWGELRDYLISNKHANTPADTLALIDIAANNGGGKIVEHEHHDKPITIALSATKMLGNRWSIATGLQYKLNTNWGIYAEPTVNWYIPNRSSTHTIWTEHPFSVTVPFGIRYTW